MASPCAWAWSTSFGIRFIPNWKPAPLNPVRALGVFRGQRLKDGKLAPEIVDKAFEETTKKFYAQSEQDLDACLATLAQLNKICDEKFGDNGPAFGPLQSALEAARHLHSRFQ